MIAPLIPTALKGVIWYQGESNVGRYKEYRELLSLMINDWRTRWGQGRISVHSSCSSRLPAAAEGCGHVESWPQLREGQWRVAETVPHAGMAVGY